MGSITSGRYCGVECGTRKPSGPASSRATTSAAPASASSTRSARPVAPPTWASARTMPSVPCEMWCRRESIPVRWAQWTPAGVCSAVRRYGSMARTASSASPPGGRRGRSPRCRPSARTARPSGSRRSVTVRVPARGRRRRRRPCRRVVREVSAGRVPFRCGRSRGVVVEVVDGVREAAACAQGGVGVGVVAEVPPRLQEHGDVSRRTAVEHGVELVVRGSCRPGEASSGGFARRVSQPPQPVHRESLDLVDRPTMASGAVMGQPSHDLPDPPRGRWRSAGSS